MRRIGMRWHSAASARRRSRQERREAPRNGKSLRSKRMRGKARGPAVGKGGPPPSRTSGAARPHPNPLSKSEAKPLRSPSSDFVCAIGCMSALLTSCTARLSLASVQISDDVSSGFLVDAHVGHRGIGNDLLRMPDPLQQVFRRIRQDAGDEAVVGHVAQRRASSKLASDDALDLMTGRARELVDRNFPALSITVE